MALISPSFQNSYVTCLLVKWPEVRPSLSEPQLGLGFHGFLLSSLPQQFPFVSHAVGPAVSSPGWGITSYQLARSVSSQDY